MNSDKDCFMDTPVTSSKEVWSYWEEKKNPKNPELPVLKKTGSQTAMAHRHMNAKVPTWCSQVNGTCSPGTLARNGEYLRESWCCTSCLIFRECVLGSDGPSVCLCVRDRPFSKARSYFIYNFSKHLNFICKMGTIFLNSEGCRENQEEKERGK